MIMPRKRLGINTGSLKPSYKSHKSIQDTQGVFQFMCMKFSRFEVFVNIHHRNPIHSLLSNNYSRNSEKRCRKNQNLVPLAALLAAQHTCSVLCTTMQQKWGAQKLSLTALLCTVWAQWYEASTKTLVLQSRRRRRGAVDTYILVVTLVSVIVHSVCLPLPRPMSEPRKKLRPQQLCSTPLFSDRLSLTAALYGQSYCCPMLLLSLM